MDKLFYKIVRPIVKVLFYILFRPEVVGMDNIPKDNKAYILAGNHTKWLDPLMLVAVSKRQVHFLAKDSLFKGIVGFIVRGMGAIPVNRKTHDKNALSNAIKCLNKNLVIGIFPEGTINRSNNVIMPFKIGTVKMASETKSSLIPFVITGEYRLFRRSIRLEFLEEVIVGNNLAEENKKLEKIIAKKLGEVKK